MALSQVNSLFAFRLYRQLVSLPEYQSDNVFFSPLSLSVALAAVSVGARGDTYEALYDGLGFNSTNLSEEEVDQGFQDILQNLNKEEKVDLRAGSALFVSNSFTPKTDFLDGMKTYFLSACFTTDFTNRAEAAKSINDYVKKETKGKITNFVDQLDPSTLMYLVSFIYFRGN